MSIRRRIVFEDGTPLPNAMFVFDVRSDTSDKDSLHYSSRQPVTDDTGYYIEYLNQPGAYIISVEYQGLSAASEPTLIAGEQRDDLVVTLNGAPIILEIFRTDMMAPTEPNRIGVWIRPPTALSTRVCVATVGKMRELRRIRKVHS